MTCAELLEQLSESPIIAAVKNDEGLEKCMASDVQVVFVLYGDVLSVTQQVEILKNGGKTVFVHIDFIDGLSTREAAVDFIEKRTRADGIISTKQALVKYAASRGLIGIQRAFLLDSIALGSVTKLVRQPFDGFIEILPGVMPKVIASLSSMSKNPIIASGLIADKEDVLGALKAGAVAVSATNPAVWLL